MKKWLLALSIAGLLAVTGVLSLYPGESGMDVQVISQEKARKIEQELSRQSEPLEFELKFAGEALACDLAGKTFFLPLSMENGEWETGSFEATDGIEVLFEEDFTREDKLSLLSQNRPISFYAVSKTGYEKYNLKLIIVYLILQMEIMFYVIFDKP